MHRSCIRFRACVGFDSRPAGVSKELVVEGRDRMTLTPKFAGHELRDAEEEANEMLDGYFPKLACC